MPNHFLPVPFSCSLHIHPDTTIGVARCGGNAIAVVGEVFHPDDAYLDRDGIAALLLRCTDNRQSEIDKLVGRFAIIDSDQRRGMSIQTDAIGMRGVYFGQFNGRTIAASSAKLAAEACHKIAKRSPTLPFKFGYPGIQTPYTGILRLPPNSSLELDSGAVRRFFPLEPIEQCEIEEAWDFAFSQAHRVVSHAVRRRPVLVSLTAGLDSRTTLAATREIWPDLSFFTYQGPKPLPHEVDVLVASDIARVFGLRHLKIDYSQFEPDPSVMTTIKDNAVGSHQRILACAYHKHFGRQGFLHIRTNLLELARSNLYGYHDAKLEFSGGPATAQKMAEFYVFVGKLALSARYVAAFEEYFAVTELNHALKFANAWDLFFVEHRMGAWHSGIVAESDVAFETVIAFNSRNLIKRFMGVPQETRNASPTLRERLRRMLPEIAQIPINPKAYPVRRMAKLLRSGPCHEPT